MQGEEVEGVGVGGGLDKRQHRGNDGAHHDHAGERGPASDRKIQVDMLGQIERMNKKTNKR